MAKKTFDLYTFVAGTALASELPFQLSCNCGGVITIMPPVQEESVICSVCERSICMVAIEGDPGYIIGRDASGKSMLIPVQGSSATPLDQMPQGERDEILRKAEQFTKEHEQKHGSAK